MKPDLLLHHGLELLAVLWILQHPLEGLRVAHGLGQVFVQQLLHVGVLEELVQQIHCELIASL